MSLVPKFIPAEPAARMTLHPTVTNKTTFLAYAAFVEAPDNPNYVFNWLLAQLETLDPDFKAWRASHPEAGVSKPAKNGNGARPPKSTASGSKPVGATA